MSGARGVVTPLKIVELCVCFVGKFINSAKEEGNEGGGDDSAIWGRARRLGLEEFFQECWSEEGAISCWAFLKEEVGEVKEEILPVGGVGGGTRIEGCRDD